MSLAQMALSREYGISLAHVAAINDRINHRLRNLPTDGIRGQYEYLADETTGSAQPTRSIRDDAACAPPTAHIRRGRYLP